MNIDRLASLLKQAAQEEIMPRFRKLDDGAVHTKTGAFDLVTEADENAERVITAAINAHSPRHVVIGEEAVSKDESLLNANFEDRVVVYVDPVDGTANFVGGLPLFAVMAGVVQNGETIAGVIYDPMGDDFVMAERGCGAWQVFADGRRKRLKFASPVALSEMGGLVSTTYLPAEHKAEISGNLAKVKLVANYRCAGHEYRLSADGHVHFQMYNKTMPWDHVAGSLIAAEAGAYVAKLDGTPYKAVDLDKGLLIAPDKDSWEALRREVFTY